jgi:hypothetical protein
MKVIFSDSRQYNGDGPENHVILEASIEEPAQRPRSEWMRAEWSGTDENRAHSAQR